jgi:hypothetical protein
MYKKTLIITIFLLSLLVFISPSACAGYPLADGAEYAYVITREGNIVIIDTATDTIVNTIHVSPGDPSLKSIAVNPSGTYLFAADQNHQYIAVYDTITNNLVKTIQTPGYSPNSIVINSNGTHAYVWAYNNLKNYVLTIDLKSFTIIKTVQATTTWSNQMVGTWGITDDDHYVVKAWHDGVLSYDTLTDTVTINNTYSAMNPEDMVCVGQYFMIASRSDSKIYQYDPATDTFTSIWTYGEQPFSITYDRLSYSLYVGFWNSSTSSTNVSKLEYYNSGSIDWNVTISPATTWPMYMELVQSGAKIYGSMDDSTGVGVLDILTLNMSKRVSTGGVTAGVITVNVVSGAGTGMQYVTFTTKTAYNTMSVGGLNVTVYDNANRLLYSGVTDDTGSCAFYLSALLQYKLLFNQTPNVNTWYNLTPSKTSYIVSIPFTDLTGLTSWSNVILPDAASNVARYTIDHPFNATSGAGYMNATYTDSASQTTTVGFFLYKNGTEIGTGNSTVLVDSSLDESAPFLCNFSIASAAGNSYQILILANQTGGEQYNYSYGLGYTFPGPKWLSGVLPLNWYFWIAFGIVLIFFSVGTISKKGLFGVFGAVSGAILTHAGWFSLNLPDAIAFSVCGVVFILSIVMYFVERERYT